MSSQISDKAHLKCEMGFVGNQGTVRCTILCGKWVSVGHPVYQPISPVHGRNITLTCGQSDRIPLRGNAKVCVSRPTGC